MAGLPLACWLLVRACVEMSQPFLSLMPRELGGCPASRTTRSWPRAYKDGIDNSRSRPCRRWMQIVRAIGNLRIAAIRRRDTYRIIWDRCDWLCWGGWSFIPARLRPLWVTSSAPEFRDVVSVTSVLPPLLLPIASCISPPSIPTGSAAVACLWLLATSSNLSLSRRLPVREATLQVSPTAGCAQSRRTSMSQSC
ncbi:hypothetical protein GGS23DRAFT_138291 [Durotheca rogersii]|uniref:uncharacterized protein n=1 Tax=Durotheca rogersii TaxID=419775 RepID=UPI00221E7977|nr:uncharacterized protein GGS23DRAFT_138291 [Durotheca rogersii]KAI5861540.1 hypothetical protein GGS23DRAFT_138291 [Durotheca rogersii]